MVLVGDEDWRRHHELPIGGRVDTPKFMSPHGRPRCHAAASCRCRCTGTTLWRDSRRRTCRLSCAPRKPDELNGPRRHPDVGGEEAGRAVEQRRGDEAACEISSVVSFRGSTVYSARDAGYGFIPPPQKKKWIWFYPSRATILPHAHFFWAPGAARILPHTILMAFFFNAAPCNAAVEVA
jgi:hypothetical protein